LKSTGALSYYDRNLLEIDWDAALLIVDLVLLFLGLKSPGCRGLTPTDPPDSRSDAKMRCWNNQEFIQILFELEAGVM